MTNLAIWLQSLILVGGSIVFGLASVWVARRITHHTVSEGHNDVLSPLFLMAGTVYAVLLAFLVIIVWESYGKAKDGITNEAAILATMYRETDAMPPATQVRIRADLRQYLTGVIDSEFNVNAYGYDVSDDARVAMSDMYKAVGQIPFDTNGTTIRDDFTHHISEVSVDRSNRLIGSDESIPWILWVPMVAGGAVVIVLGAFLYMERRWLHVAMVGILSGLLGLMLLTASLLSHPYTGKLQVKPDAFDGTGAVFDAVDGGH